MPNRLNRSGHSVALVARLLLPLALLLQSYLLYAPVTDSEPLPPHVDKFIHAGMFGGTTWLAVLAGWRWAPWFFATYAPVSEVIQGTAFIGRDADWRDALADIVGVLMAIAVLTVSRRRSGALD